MVESLQFKTTTLQVLYPFLVESLKKMSSKLDWGTNIVYILSIKSPSSEAAFCLYQSTKWSYLEYCCHFWACAPRCYPVMLHKLNKRVCKTASPTFVASLEPFTDRKNVASASLFYRYSFGRCSCELGTVLFPQFCERPTYYYNISFHKIFANLVKHYEM